MVVLLRAHLFVEFWSAVCARRTAATLNGVDEQGNNISVVHASDADNAVIPWPGERGLLNVLRRPMYNEVLQDIMNHFASHANQKLYYTITGSPGIGKTQFIGFLLESLAQMNPIPAIRIHYSTDPEQPDIWLWVDDQQQPHVVFCDRAPKDYPLQPYCFISDTYPVLKERSCSHLHLHIVSMDQDIYDWTQFVHCMDEAVNILKIFSPFSRSEHLWCRGHWHGLDNAAASHQQKVANATVEANNAHHASTMASQRQRNKENPEDGALQVVLDQLASKWTATLAACTAAGGDASKGVWTNWEELQLHYDVFGGCMRTLTMSTTDSYTREELEELHTMLNDFFLDVVTASGRLLTEEYTDELTACSFTLAAIVRKIMNCASGANKQKLSTVNARMRSYFKVVVPTSGSVYLEEESSKFMSYVQANAYSSVNSWSCFKTMLLAEMGSDAMKHAYERAAHTLLIEKLKSSDGLPIRRIYATTTRATLSLKVDVRHRVFIRRWEDITALPVGDYGIPMHTHFGLCGSIVKAGPNDIYCFQMMSDTHRGIKAKEADMHRYLLPPAVAVPAGPRWGKILVHMVFVLDTENYNRFYADSALPASRWAQYKTLGTR